MAQRTRALHTQLLDSGSLSAEDVAGLRGTDENSARDFVATGQTRCRLFTVRHGQSTLVPQILLDADGELTEVSRAVEVLVPLGLDGWELWSWLASPSGWLSGEIPSEVFATDPSRAMTAVRAYAAELAVTADL